jgi:hypothetical protein
LADGYELTVSNLLSLQSGDIRLTGEAQIVQSGLVANPVSGTGKIYRDQQGTRSSFNYNYWSSPVSDNGIDYTIADVLRDGTDVTTNPFAPTAITFYLAPILPTVRFQIQSRSATIGCSNTRASAPFTPIGNI